MIQEIKDIYSYQKSVPAPMLSSYSADFWKPYRDNYAYYDRIFMKKYRSWFPMDQEGDLEDIAEEFAEDVKSWLMINDKRYSELFRIQTIPDDEQYSLTDNVFEHEEIETEYGKKVTFNKGEQTIEDAGTNKYGVHETTDNRTLTYDDHEIETGTTDNLGATEKTTINSTSAFNESDYTPTDKSVESTDAVENGSSKTVTDKSHEDTDNKTITSKAHTDEIGNTRTDGEREDTTEDSGTDTVTRDRHGNIGTVTVDKMLSEHVQTWVDFSFFELIFSEIARELLRGWRFEF